MQQITEMLTSNKDAAYAEFISSLAPTLPKDCFIGVRVPALRLVAKQVKSSGLTDGFLAELPHKYYEENLLHSILLCETKDYTRCLSLVTEFLPYVDNWAVCDTLRPKVFAKHKSELLPIVKGWIKSDAAYTCRFGLDMLMTYYLDAEFTPDMLSLAAAVNSDEYYVKMMVAWFFATALAKQWNAAIPYITERKLPDWTHKKTIQKAIESYRITDEQKAYLRSLK